MLVFPHGLGVAIELGNTSSLDSPEVRGILPRVVSEDPALSFLPGLAWICCCHEGAQRRRGPGTWGWCWNSSAGIGSACNRFQSQLLIQFLPLFIKVYLDQPAKVKPY